jgi:nitrogen fixation protein FixH
MSASAPRLNGRHVLAALLGFFAVVMAANGVFVWLALGSFTGIEAPHAYRSGLHYNQELANAAAQAALGWRAEIDVASQDHATTLRVTVRDAAAKPLDGLVVSAVWRRPTQAAWDREVTLEPAGPGRYAASLALPAPGQWDLRLTARHPAQGGSYRIDRRILVQ